MTKKPEGCQGCPLYGSGNGFVQDSITPDAPVTIINTYPRTEEVSKGYATPTVEFSKKYLEILGESCSHGHLIRCRPEGTKRGQMANVPLQTLRQAASHCQRYATDTARVRVAQGEEALAIIDHSLGSIHDWRGFLHPEPYRDAPLYIVADAMMIHKQPELELITRLDYSRLRRIVSGLWPESLPTGIMWTDTAKQWFSMALAQPEPIAIDTEYTRDGYITLIGLHAPGVGVLQWDPQDPDGATPTDVANTLLSLVQTHPILFQNSFADMPRLLQNFGIPYTAYKHIEDTMLAHSVLWSELPHSLKFLESLYGRHNKMKHLANVDKRLYNMGDVLTTSYVWANEKRDLESDKQAADVYQNIVRPLIPIVARVNERGIAVNRRACEEIYAQLDRDRQYAQELAEAYAGYPITLGGSAQILTYLNKHEKYKLKTLDADTLTELRAAYGVSGNDFTTMESVARVIEEDGGHPLLEARALYAQSNQLLSHYIKPFLDSPDGKIYPEFHIHAQANARWSIVKPPLQQLPPDMKRLLMPDKGRVWVSWDFDQAELRVATALANDEPMQEAFDKGWDVHTLNMCDALGYDRPPSLITPYDVALCGDWMGKYGFKNKDDIRRTFTKRFIFRLLYGGDPRHADNIPGAKKLGLDGQKLIAAAKRWLRAHPAVARYWRTLEATAVKHGLVRNIFGRPRRMLTDNLAAKMRIASNHPMQATVADIKNIIIRQAHDRWTEEECFFVFEVHDFLCFSVREDLVEKIQPELQSLASQEWKAGDVPFTIPQTFKRWYHQEVL